MIQKLLLCLLVLCLHDLTLNAQYQSPVAPVVSGDYLELVRSADSSNNKNRKHDSSASVTLYTRTGVYRNVRAIRQNGTTIKFLPANDWKLRISGNYSGTFQIKSLNRQPALQNTYVQGRTVNGQLQWQGPETNEMFSYGPPAGELEYDGSSYPYDINGRLVAKGNGKGLAANIYTPSVLRTGYRLSNSLSFDASIHKNYGMAGSLSLKAGQHSEETIIRSNRNSASNFSISTSANIRKYVVTVNAQASQTRFTLSNRAGLLNRIYQADLLTPISFDNEQGILLSPGKQRSYSNNADNPYFLLQSHGQGQQQQQQLAGITITKRFERFNVSLQQSYTNTRLTDNQHYQAGTAYFLQGLNIRRDKIDRHHYLKVSGTYDLERGEYFDGFFSANYAYSNATSGIDYRDLHAFRYKRSSHEGSLNAQVNYRSTDLSAAVYATNHFYASNTARRNDPLVPSAGAYIRIDDIFDSHTFHIKLGSAFTQLKTEAPVNRSFSYLNLLKHYTSEALQYQPLQEAVSFRNLALTKHNEFTGSFELYYRYYPVLTVNFYHRNIHDDVFPVMKNGMIILENNVSHHNTGYEIIFDHYHTRRKFTLRNSLSFSAFHNKVDYVKDDAIVPMAGFANVHKAMVKGYSPGVIMGNRYLRNNNGDIVIGNDGFPLVDNGLHIVGDPTPDFTLKLSTLFNIKNFNASIDLEWCKGGEIWNGTQAVLDYYGRSHRSASQRNTSDHVFTGVLQNGQANNIPVRFYDPSLPFEQNRWVRYGYSGVAGDHIEKADQLRLNNISASYEFRVNKFLHTMKLTGYITNLVVWSAYNGTDARQLLYDEPRMQGLDLFNLPSTTGYGINISLQF